MFYRFVRHIFILILTVCTWGAVLAESCLDTFPQITGPVAVVVNSSPVRYVTPDISGHYYIWEVRDGAMVVGTSSTAELYQIWDKPGNFQITLKEGITGNACDPVSVTMDVVVNPLLFAHYYYEPDAMHQCVFNEVTFTATGNGTYDPILKDPLISYTWEWSLYNPPNPMNWNNTSITQLIPDNSIVKIQFPFAPGDPGKVYATRLTVSKMITGKIWTDTITDYEYVDPGKHKPQLSYKSTPGPNSPLEIIFDAAINSTSGIQVVWDFGDNSTGYGLHIVHTYPYAADWVVMVTAIDTVTGCETKLSDTITAGVPPSATFWADPTKRCQGESITFRPRGEGGTPTTDRYHFDDGTPDEYFDANTNVKPGQPIIHTFNVAGTRIIERTVDEGLPTEDSYADSVIIHPAPVSSFIVGNISVDKDGQHVTMNNLSAGAEKYEWYIDDDTIPVTTENPVFTFAEEGTYMIGLRTFGNFQCSDTAYFQLKLHTKGLYVPNAFMPASNDEATSLFKPVGVNLKQHFKDIYFYRVMVFDIWGHLLWQSVALDSKGSPTEGWDGTFRGKVMPQGTYMWKISAVFDDDSTWNGSDVGEGASQTTMGTVVLIR